MDPASLPILGTYKGSCTWQPLPPYPPRQYPLPHPLCAVISKWLLPPPILEIPQPLLIIMTTSSCPAPRTIRMVILMIKGGLLVLARGAEG